MTGSEIPKLILQLRELVDSFRDHAIRHAVIGGIAVNVHGYVRATQDLDLLIAIEQESEIEPIMTALGYHQLDRRDDLSSYVRGAERVDLLHARRDISKQLLAEARIEPFAGTGLSVVSIEGLFGFKIQALNDDPHRLRDMVDMLELLRVAGDRIDLDQVRGYFRLFNREALLDELLRAVAADRT